MKALKLQVVFGSLIAVLVSLQLILNPFNLAQTSQSESVSGSKHVLTEEFSQEMSFEALDTAQMVRLSGGWEWQSVADGSKVARSRFNDAQIEGVFNGSWLEMRLNHNKQIFEVQVDNIASYRIVAPGGGTEDYVRLISGLATGKHRFQVHLLDRAGTELRASSLRTDGGWQTLKPLKRRQVLGYGSSSIDDCGIVWGLGQALGWEGINRGLGGTTVIEEGQKRVERDLGGFQPDVVLLLYGSNDWVSDVALPDFETAYLNMLRQIVKSRPRSRFVVIDIYPRKGGNEATRPLYNQAVHRAIANADLTSRTQFLEIANYKWTTDTNDGTHPNPAAVANKFIPQLLTLFQQYEPASR